MKHLKQHQRRQRHASDGAPENRVLTGLLRRLLLRLLLLLQLLRSLRLVLLRLHLLQRLLHQLHLAHLLLILLLFLLLRAREVVQQDRTRRALLRRRLQLLVQHLHDLVVDHLQTVLVGVRLDRGLQRVLRQTPSSLLPAPPCTATWPRTPLPSRWQPCRTCVRVLSRPYFGLMLYACFAIVSACSSFYT